MRLLVGFAVSGWSAWALLFAVAWVVAYPATYFLGRALTTRVRRGTWSRLARREAERAAPWAVLLLGLGLPLLVAAPWLLVAGAFLVLLWLVSLALGSRFGERSVINDSVLVGQAVCAVPLVWAVSATTGVAAGVSTAPSFGDAPAGLWEETLAVALFLAGSVLHVKSLLRKADDPRYHWANVVYHGVVCLALAWVSLGWLIGFGPACARAVVLRPGLRPAVIGAVEVVVSGAMVLAAFVVV